MAWRGVVVVVVVVAVVVVHRTARSRWHAAPHLFAQFLPMLRVVMALRLKLPVCSATGLQRATWWAVLGLCAAANLMELADQSVFDTMGVVSGHTLKHLLAAAEALCLLRGLISATRQLR